ncbi:hypothetical protein BU23DRAFT_134352 [Bimuria novae-zelandiae CBS 107.79]|uniref:DUF6594 domain-containing protein n=1 Tax=Bimuria novae-zelandiae CBS 107.79 TaxID=1447943 RepID=A0A6A5V9F1_9PLEO|nr:hypothetical protein BU23DRAFT_134352 [Bimuria novae-zelandiae CBS 107.79]
MTEPRTSVEGLFGRARRQSPNSEASSVLSRGRSGLELPGASPVLRRRSSHTRETTDDASNCSSQLWVAGNKDVVRKAKGGRSASRKAVNVPSQSLSELSVSDTGKDTDAFMPRLDRIREGKESKTLRRKRRSTISSVARPSSSNHANRSVDVTTLKKRSTEQRHSSLQRVERNLANLQNPSLISVLSGLTQQSHVSSESSSTITQQTYDRKLIAKRKPTKDRKKIQQRRLPSKSEPANMASPQPSVFQYMKHAGDDDCASPSSSTSSSSSSSSDAEHDHVSSAAEEPVIESPPTSPASTRKLNHEDSHEEGGTDSETEPRVLTRPRYQPSVSEVNSESDAQSDEVEEDEEVDEEEAKRDEIHTSAGIQPRQPSYASQMALERVPPPRVPSSSSHHSDRHTRRLKRQEQALNEHILQNPQPQRDFHFTGAPSPHYAPTMPMYDPYRSSGASPVSYTQSAHHAPPAAPPPPPTQAIGYYSPAHAPPVPYSSGYDHETAMTARPPMAPSVVAQPSQLQYSPMHPPQYQVRPPGPDLSKRTVVGYELLADRLSSNSKNGQVGQGEESVVPMYRKFGNLNHRVLLHLQDEISELEEELRYLDECIAQCSPRDHAGHHHPASRRGDARYGGEMHYWRTELLGRIYLKLGQYNSALTSFNTMVKNLDPANTEEIQAYHSWMEKHAPIDHMESRFLEHKNDLLTVSEGRSATTLGGVAPRQSGAIWLPLVLVLPLMMFAIVPGMLGRLVTLSITGAATAKLISSTEELMEMMAPREWVGCFSV